jgi:Predicted sugar kinase
MKIGIISKITSEAVTLAQELINKLIDKGVEIYLEEELAKELNYSKVLNFKDNLDYLIWIGGDGTLLKFINNIANLETKILGIKLGKVAFLCEIYPNQIDTVLNNLFKEKFKIESKGLLEVVVGNNKYYALNEVLFCVKELGKTSYFKVLKENAYLFDGKCDGVIIATSTGSTAYIASRNGPIIDPSLDLIIIDPLNPLRWGSRKIIIPFNSSLKIYSNENFLTVIDGNIKIYINKEEEIKVQGSSKRINFVRFSENFFERIKIRSLLDV